MTEPYEYWWVILLVITIISFIISTALIGPWMKDEWSRHEDYCRRERERLFGEGKK